MSASTVTLPDCDNSEYTSCYCEENIYWLVRRVLGPPGGEQQWDVFSVFISNPTRTVTDMTDRPVRTSDSEVYHTGGIMEPANGIIQRYTDNMGLSRRLGATRALASVQPIAGLPSKQRAGHLDL